MNIKETFNKLSKIDVNPHTEKKGQFTYLAWTWAWKTLVENTDSASYVWNEDKVFADGTMEVSCNLTVNENTLSMWGAVTDHKNHSIKDPDSHSINTARMRCLVKAMAMFGLGHYIYAGESFPDDVEEIKLNGTRLPANSNASPELDAARNTESLTFVAEPDAIPSIAPQSSDPIVDIKEVYNSTPKAGHSQDKTYFDQYGSDDSKALVRDLKYWESRKTLNPNQQEHLDNLRLIRTRKNIDNIGVAS